MIDGAQTLKNHLTEEIRNPGKNSSNINEAFKQFGSVDKAEDWISVLSNDLEILTLLLKNSDSSVSLVRTLYPILYSLVQHNTDQSLGLVSQFTPTLIWQYLSSAGSDQCKQPESILMHLANKLSERSGLSFRLPSIHMISVYHHPARMQYTGGLTEASLSKSFNMDPVYSDEPGDADKYTTVNASNRLALLTLLLEKYNYSIGGMTPASLERFCWLCAWVTGSGMLPLAIPASEGKFWSFAQIRFTLNKGFMTALGAGLQFCMYNGQHAAAKAGLDILAMRAKYEVCAEVMMLTASLQDTISKSPVSPASKPFGILVPELSGTQDSTRPVRRSIVRNDDIQAVRRRVSSNEIREEGENETVEERERAASVIVECEDSDESDILIAGFRGGKLQNSPV